MAKEDEVPKVVPGTSYTDGARVGRDGWKELA